MSNYTFKILASGDKSIQDGNEKYQIVDSHYGKSLVKFLRVERNGKYHQIKEVEVDTKITLSTHEAYTTGDNKNIIATDTQKNIVHILAKKYGVKSVEDFALVVSNFLLRQYPQVVKTRITVKEFPWQRLTVNGVEHNHAFVAVPVAERWAEVTEDRNSSPRVTSGLSGLRVLKTTKTGFVNFVNDEYRTLPDANDRIFSTIVASSWEYSTIQGLDFDHAWETVRDVILEKFAGEPVDGHFSPSVQNTLYEAQVTSLDRIPHIEKISMEMPNKHYFDIDMSRFPKSMVGYEKNNEVFLQTDYPSGYIYAVLARRQKSKL